MTETDELIPVGKISGTHGIKGQLRLYSYSGNLESLLAADSVVLKDAKGLCRSFTLKGVSRHSAGFIIRLNDFDNINQVESLVGSELCLSRSQLPEPEEDEYYWCDLLGVTVLTNDGRTLGTIVDIFETASSDIYVVRDTQREYLIPAIADVVNAVDLAKRTMYITPLDGLLDL